MVRAVLFLAFGLVLLGVLPNPFTTLVPPAVRSFLSDFYGPWVEAWRRAGAGPALAPYQPIMGWACVTLGALRLRHPLFAGLSWPIRHAYWLRWIFGGRIFGQARWAKLRDLRRAGMLEPGGLFLGALKGRDFFHNAEGHLLTIAGVGGGKSSGLVVPTLLTLSNGSVIVADPSGELAAMTARHRGTVGPVVFLNPFGSVFTQETGVAFRDTGFNPLSILDPESSTFHTDVSAFARLLMVTDRRESGSYWNDEGAEFLALLIAGLKRYHHPELHTLAALYEFIRDPPERMAAELESLAEKDDLGIALEAERFLGLLRTAPQQWAGVLSKAALATKRYAPGSPLGFHTAKNGFAVSDLKTKRVSVYLLVPSSLLASSLPWLNLLVGVFGTAIGRPGPRSPVTFLIDEAPALGFLPDLRSHMAQFRKAGLRVWLFTQTYAAMAGPELYGETGMKEIMGLTAVKQFFSVEEPEVQKLVSELCGMRSIANPSTSGTIGDVGQPLIRPDEVRGLKKWHQLLIVGGLRYPIRAKLVPYFWRRAWRSLVDPNPYRSTKK